MIEDDYLPDNLVTYFVKSEIVTMLNDYGKALLNIDTINVRKFHSYRRPQLYSGIIGTSPIQAIFSQGSDSPRYSEIHGIYAYEKYGTGIELNGELHGNQITVTESGCKDCKITATLKKGTVSGQWSNDAKHYTFFAGQE